MHEKMHYISTRRSKSLMRLKKLTCLPIFTITYTSCMALAMPIFLAKLGEKISSMHCREAANTARRLFFMVRRSFCKLSKTEFMPLGCAIVRPYLEYAMEAKAPTLTANINQLERVQRLATRLVKGIRHVPYEERFRQLNLFSMERRHLRADFILAFKIFKDEVDLNPSDFFLRPPEPGYEGTPIDYCKDQTVFDAGAAPFLLVS